ncbi:hypothetical protein AYR62_07945 [Secundilactobacillus paracollinoides]|uniref:YihY/virulence factor BrkB family protein n=1 Tax=Secundilactobacillus paracollinoides TaxID=240427 RepID=UPI0006F0C5A7|nr:YihY/virulence factor BrkB family protein [Secundilactobacillus paracollinoides]ANZ64013.1 hypothetical protein AYR62_07945 [Secundilactobacillus paracollinoides]KRL78991.1 ribonuclease BN-like family protein [Secundilactobacillus paracollinoides DSM 15502 = JCM 11969]
MQKRSLGLFIKALWAHYQSANVSDSASVLSYYMMMSVFPIFLIVGNLIAFLHIKSAMVLHYLKPVLPLPFYQTLAPVIRSFLEQGSTGTLSIGIIVTIWSASKMVAAFQRSINQAYGIHNTNAVISRFFSFIFIVVLVIGITLLGLLFGLSEAILRVAKPWFQFSNQFTAFIGNIKWPISFIGIFVLSYILYAIVPSVRVKYRYVWAGALVTTAGWLGLGQIFSLYIRYFETNVTSYKTISTFIILMLWMNLAGMVLLIGGIVNATLQEWFQGEIQEMHFVDQIMDTARHSHQKHLAKKKHSGQTKAKPTPPKKKPTNKTATKAKPAARPKNRSQLQTKRPPVNGQKNKPMTRH